MVERGGAKREKALGFTITCVNMENKQRASGVFQSSYAKLARFDEIFLIYIFFHILLVFSFSSPSPALVPIISSPDVWRMGLSCFALVVRTMSPLSTDLFFSLRPAPPACFLPPTHYRLSGWRSSFRR